MRYILFVIFTIVAVFRYFIYKKRGKNASFLWVSLFIQLTPLACILVRFGDLPYKEMPGAFDTYFSIYGLWIVCILMFLLKIKKQRDIIKFPIFLFIVGLLFFELISLFNFNNSISASGLPIGFRLLQIVFIIKFICSYVNKENLIYGLFDGFKYAIYLQFVLTIFFPVLGMDFVCIKHCYFL